MVVGRRNIIARVLNKYFSGKQLRILDWGCGPGGNFKLLERYGQVLGVDASDESVSACRRKGITAVLKAEDLSGFRPNTTYDLITNFDVLEHISDDVGFLRGVRELLTNGGYMMVTVPAYQFLWGQLDEVVGHKRRYTKKEIVRKFNQCGFSVVKASYFNFFISPALLRTECSRLKRNTRSSLSGSVVEFPALVNWLFTKIVFLKRCSSPHQSAIRHFNNCAG